MLRVDQFVPLLTDDAKLLDALPDCVLEKALPRLLAMLPEELQGAVDRFLALPGTPDLAQGSDPPTVDSAAAGRPPGEAVPEGPAEATAEDEDEYAEIWKQNLVRKLTSIHWTRMLAVIAKQKLSQLTTN